MKIYRISQQTKTYTVAISKAYFRKEFWPITLGHDIFEQLEVEASNRQEAAQKAWELKKDDWEQKMLPASRLGRKVSLYVDDPGSVMQGLLTRLPPVRI